MISMTLCQSASLLHGKLYGCDLTFNTVAIDTRQITTGCLFIALKGKRFDSHNFVEQIQKSGAGALLVSRKVETDLPQILVRDTYLALEKLAACVRQQVPVHLVALTGSSGKTSVKEMTAAILQQCGNTLYTKGNFNNLIGVSMTLLRLTPEHQYAVIELGANQPGEIARTVNLTRPQAVLVTNLSSSHLEGFGSFKGVLKAKGEIYTGLTLNGIAIINDDENDWNNWKHIIRNRKTWRFSLKSSHNDFTATDIHISSYGSKFKLQTPNGSTNVLLPLLGNHNIANALAASALSMAVGATLETIKIGLKNVRPIPGRLFPIKLSKNKLLLDDSYNANLGSMTTAIQVLSERMGYRVLVVGDMDELGKNSKVYHTKVGKIAKTFGIDRVLSIGHFSQFISKESLVGEHFLNKETLISRLKTLIEEKEVVTVVVKGSRSASMEKVVRALEEKKTC